MAYHEGVHVFMFSNGILAQFHHGNIPIKRLKVAVGCSWKITQLFVELWARETLSKRFAYKWRWYCMGLESGFYVLDKENKTLFYHQNGVHIWKINILLWPDRCNQLHIFIFIWRVWTLLEFQSKLPLPISIASARRRPRTTLRML